MGGGGWGKGGKEGFKRMAYHTGGHGIPSVLCARPSRS